MESLDKDSKNIDKDLLFVMSRDILAQLLSLFNDFSDEIPKEIIRSSTANNQYKVRGGRFFTVSLKISRLHMYGLIPDEIQEESDLCIQNYHLHHNQNGGLTTQEDIDTMNTILSKTIDYLQTHK